jgi:TRAP-type C4-dicarboxylate transport system permease small subunit
MPAEIPRSARDDVPGQTQGAEDHVLGEDGRFHAVDEEVRLSLYGWEDWIVLAVFWILAFVVFYQVFTRYVLNDAAGWTEEIARYLLIAVTFLGGAMAVRRGTHIQVDVLYRFLPPKAGRALALFVDAVRIAFFGYAAWLAWLLIDRIGTQRMAVVELPIGLVFGAMLMGFALMFGRSVQIAWRDWRRGYSALERPEIAHGDGP